MGFSIENKTGDAASCRVKMRLQGCRFYALAWILFLLFSAYGEEGAEPATVRTQSDCDKVAILDLRVVYEEESLSGLVAPPAGVYPFEPGDGVVLRAYGMGEIPVAIEWSGDVSGNGETRYVDMDGHKKITVTFKRAAQWPKKEEPPWFDVTENKNFYAFVGGGDLYGWFAACRHEKKGAGITHLTHRKAFLNPVFHITSLNFEHIFSGLEADNYRSVFTPRTDPMKFCVESPGAVRVQWPKEGASWDMESEMVYRFDGKDAIDISFSTVPGNEQFSQGYVGFMWATYQSNFKEHVIYFPGISGEQPGWVRYGPTIREDRFGGTVAFKGSAPLPLEIGASAFNVIESEKLFFTQPYYYGLLDVSVPKSSQQANLVYAMLFDQESPIRYAVWNWGDPPETSAWDWQYVANNPEPGKKIQYTARMICAELDAPDGVTARYEAWKEIPKNDGNYRPEILSYPDMPIYWSPASILFDPLVVGECMERNNPDHALILYREALISLDDAPRIAAKMDELLSHEYDNDRRIEEWLYILDRRKNWVGEAMPVLLLAHAYHDKGDIVSALDTIRRGIEEQPNNAEQLFLYGELLMEAGEVQSGIDAFSRAIQSDAEKASPAGEFVAKYAQKAADGNDLDQAEILYRAAVNLAPSDHWHKVKLGELLEKKGRDTEAESLYCSVLLAAPESPYTAERVDTLFTQRNDTTGRIEFWRELYKQHPNAAVPSLHLGKACYDHKEYAETEKILATAMTDYPDNQDIQFYLGAARFWLGKDEEGVRLMEEAAAKAPALAEPAAAVYSKRAASLLENGDYSLAEKYCRLAIALAPENIWYPIYLGEALQKQGQDTEAIDLYIKGINSDPESVYIANLIHGSGDTVGQINIWRSIVENHPDAFLPKLYLTRACYEGGEYERAVAAADEAGQNDNQELMLYRCGSLLHLDKLEDGIACLSVLAQTNPDMGPAVGMAYSTRAQKAYTTGDFLLAERLYRNAMLAAPNDLWHTIHLAETLEKLERNVEALTLYTQVLVVAKDAPRTAAMLDALLLRAFDMKRRVSVWSEICKQIPDTAQPLLYLGKAFEQAGNRDSAVESYRGALRIDDTLEEAQAGLARLEKLEKD